MSSNRSGHIRLNSHPGGGTASRFPIQWGAPTAAERGPIIVAKGVGADRNAIGAHGGAYSLYRALAISSGAMNTGSRPDLTDTHPTTEIGPFGQWMDPAKIVSLDPWGHLVGEAFKDDLRDGVDIRPTIAITRARLTLPEISQAIDAGRLTIDGSVLHESRDVAVTKAAVDPVWYLPGIAERFGVSETVLRRTLFEETGGMYADLVTRPDIKVFLPPIGGITLYIFGDPAKVADPAWRLTCRVHDECNGSDVFGSDICTCRPYLTHGIEECVREAQNGGAGLIVYNRKEGRALGEVTKFLVYNARKRQPGGDQAATYFERTECVAGVQDARFQQLMPDVLHWLGITRIDRFVSMSNMKYDALAGSGIEIVERVPIPDDLIPEDASVEMEAKKAAGYFTPDAPPSAEDLSRVVGRDLGNLDSPAAQGEPRIDADENLDARPARRLLSAAAVRETAHAMLKLGVEGKLDGWRVDLDRLIPTAAYVAAVTRERYPTLETPFHSRWRHFVFEGVDLGAETLAVAELDSPDHAERARSAFDLAIVSVLLDAGSGPDWRYRDAALGIDAARSEGLALASLRLFQAGAFSAHPLKLLRTDASALADLTEHRLAEGFQVSDANPLSGLEGRVALLNRLGKQCEARPDLFALTDSARPGGLFDAMAARAVDGRLPAPIILEVLLEALGPIWQDRLSLGGVDLGDCWRHPAIVRGDATDGLVPIHKLSQWLAYSLVEPLQAAGVHVTDLDGLTGLAEYRNGGLFMDMGVLVLTDPADAARAWPVSDPLIVAWRSMTVALLDHLAPLVRADLGISAESMPLASVLEGGTWAAGRRIAAQKRDGGGPPLTILSDGTVF